MSDQKQAEPIYVGTHVPFKHTWHWCLAGDESLVFNMVGKPPNRFHRWALRVFLSVHVKLKNQPQESSNE